MVRGASWSKFSDSIKNENRFHSGMFNADVFASFLSIVAKNYPAGSKMFRARIAPSKSGFPTSGMSIPPKSFRSAGRVNPEGIGILYLSSDDKTVLNEVRANTFDYVCIGEFQSKRDIMVVNLSGLSSTSPFLYDGELEKYAANRKVFQEIAIELARPLRRSDSPLEYLPTQYISEFIKNQKRYDGIEYASTLRDGGYNLALFDEELFECVNVYTTEVTGIEYKTRQENLQS
ncbi:RES family NAD+ phosphorylase [Stenoxybacter acetivorans]|uniref:RES family NAD+ phosphorylase n=1 Tax=Stenoxybacter acetivorans TaxID=422441 RepID=UPI0012EB74B5|nr:RES family NAD+ phosphorylase [Stenoxybacter acetivorans]